MAAAAAAAVAKQHNVEEYCAKLLHRIHTKSALLLLNVDTAAATQNHAVFSLSSRSGLHRMAFGECDDSMCETTIFPSAKVFPEQSRFAEVINDAVVADAACDRAVGSLVGLVLGDAFGAPLEFLSCLAPEGQSYLARDLDSAGDLVYVGEGNKFGLKRGQWTDDASMALCLADSLLVRAVPLYHDGDCRVRYCNWWFHGYNNAFRCDSQRASTFGRTSVGLGGNISSSLYGLREVAMQRSPPRVSGDEAMKVPFRTDSRDSGNGSIMRLAPVPIRFHRDPVAAVDNSILSSYTTHLGGEAAACCAFMAFFISRAIHRPTDTPATLSAFIDETIAAYTDVLSQTQAKTIREAALVTRLLQCDLPSEKEACWNWRTAGKLPLRESLAARRPSYNGHPVSAGYFGAYACDGLAVALWGMRRSTCFHDVVLDVANVLGDADSTCAIACQLAGAFYGYRSMSRIPASVRMLEHLWTWDPEHQIPMRALLLYYLGSRDATKSTQEPELV